MHNFINKVSLLYSLDDHKISMEMHKFHLSQSIDRSQLESKFTGIHSMWRTICQDYSNILNGMPDQWTPAKKENKDGIYKQMRKNS